jgi:uncharacterized membrane protein
MTEGSFAARLSVRDRRLALRLEGFGDIVFGFAVSQCALQLPTVNGHVDVAHVWNLFYYFGTFALLASLWLTYHRLMSGPFKPSGIDLFIAFTYLALVSLMPYAMYSVSHATESLASARTAVAAYALIFALLMGLAAVLTLRNLRRGWWDLDDEGRGFTWIAFLRRCVVFALMMLGFATDLVFGPAQSSIPFCCLFIANLVIRIRFKKAPTAAAFRIAPDTRERTVANLR